MKPEQDAFGRALYDAWKGKGRGFHVVEREDGMLDAMESKTYFAPYRRWPGFERRAVRYARGRVLDVGCGAGRTTDRGVVLAGGRDPYWGAPAEHRRYHRWNRQRGRMGGQIRLRVRYRSYATPWLDYLFVSRRELQALLRGTGWHIRRFLPPTGQLYVAVLAKEREDPRPLAGRASC